MSKLKWSADAAYGRTTMLHIHMGMMLQQCSLWLILISCYFYNALTTADVVKQWLY